MTTQNDVIEQAKSIKGRYYIGLPSMTNRAFDELGPEGVLDIFRRYAAADWPGQSSAADDIDAIPAPNGCFWQGPLHQAIYRVNGQEYVALTEAHAQSWYSQVTTIMHADEYMP